MISHVECRSCPTCSIRAQCTAICDDVESQLPSMETGRVDYEDLQNLYVGRIMTRIILDNEDSLTDKQKEVVRLYYRESMLQKEIAIELGISQQAVSDHLEAVKNRLWKTFKKNREFKQAARSQF
jgi:DNA-directed RNA polymerase specialized sigma subunit